MKKILLLALTLLSSPALAVNQGVLIGDANYTVKTNDTMLFANTTLTATRTVTLPNAGSTCIGQGCALSLQIIDTSGGVGPTNCLSIAPASGETIIGSSSPVSFCNTRGSIDLYPVTPGNWTYLISPLASGTYTEGTWTPTFIGSSTPGTGQSYAVQVGNYERVGRQVTIRFAISATSLGTAAGNLNIGNLPFANGSTVSGFCVVPFYIVTGLSALTYGVTGYINVGGSAVNLVSGSTTGSTSITVTQSGNTPTLQGFCNYSL